MRVFSADDLRPLMDLRGLIGFMEERHRAPKCEAADSLIGGGGARYLIRSAASASAFCSKLITIAPANASRGLATVQALLVIFDRETGAPRAILDSTELTYWKTAADSGLGSSFLSREDSRTLLVCGAGGLAPWLARGHLAARPSIANILVWNRTPAKAEMLAAQLRGEALPARAVDDLEQAVQEADIVSTATLAAEPFLRGDWLRPGQHLDLVGSFGPDTREADDLCIARAKIFVDCRESALAGVGDILAPIASGVLTPEKIRADLYGLACGSEGRVSANDITLFKNAGGAHLDLMTAEFLLGRAAV